MPRPRTKAMGVALPPTVYRTSWRSSASTPWELGAELTLGFTQDPAHGIPQPSVHLMGEDLTPYAALTVDAKRCLVVAIDLGSVEELVCAATPEQYLQCTATLSADGLSFVGRITRRCSGPVEQEWTGETSLASAPWLEARNQFVRAVSRAQADHSRTEHDAGVARHHHQDPGERE